MMKQKIVSVIENIDLENGIQIIDIFSSCQIFNFKNI
jgi:hypothetical protein